MTKIDKALKNDMEALKKFGVIYPKADLIKSIGIKYYLIFWKRRRYMANEILKRVIDEV